MKTALSQKSQGILKIVLLAGAFVALTACQKAEDISVQNANLSHDSQSAGILSGRPVQQNDTVASSTVALYDIDSEGVFCTGSIVSKNVIITAAHCLIDSGIELNKIAIVFSTKAPDSHDEFVKLPFRMAADAKVHKLYNPQSERAVDLYDLALIKIEGQIPSSHRAIRLMDDNAKIHVGMNVTLAGFGITDGLRQTRTAVLRQVSIPLASKSIGNTEIAFDQRKLPVGACSGDSGGPAIVQSPNDQPAVLIGVTSRGVGPQAKICKAIAVYTSIAAHLEWIFKGVRELNL